MADYHPLILRAVEGLDKNTGENRRALYERARTALVAQLRGVVPPLDESEITRERLALEEAIRKVEAESARRAREEPRKPAPLRPAAAPRREEFRREEPARAAPPPPPPPDPWADLAQAGSPETRDAPRERSAPEHSLTDEAVRGFRDAMSDPLGETPPRPARQPYSQPHSYEPALPRPPTPQDFDRQDTRHETRHERESSYEQRRPQQPDDQWAPPPPPQEPPPSFEFSEPPPAPARPRRAEPPQPQGPRPPRAYARLIKLAAVVLLCVGLGALAWWQRDTISGAAGDLIALVSGSGTPAPRGTTTPQQRPKITDRLGQPSAPQPSGAPGVGQRVVLYEEDPDDPQGKRLLGSAVWRTEMMAPAPGRPAELAVRADIEIPERKMTMIWSLRRNADASLPASHTIEIMFNLPQDAPSGGVQNVPGVLMKQAEQTRGVPLAGLAVKVTPGFFLIGLSAVENDMQRNIQLLKERGWFDIPMVYANNRRAILAMEKGTPGERAFSEAFTVWRQ